MECLNPPETAYNKWKLFIIRKVRQPWADDVVQLTLCLFLDIRMYSHG
jgi:hypothetical protein